ncbi:MAG: sigma-70 family RNA polymerase sigma factor [Verrucomicrobiia bacterium]
MNGIQLLDEFRTRRSELAFSELVRRYTNLVYSVAKRRLGSEALAQDASQNVFIRLASHPPALSTEAELTAWLHRTTVHVSIDLWRSESRRHAREETAATMQTHPDTEPSWTDIAPALDEALNELSEPDRQAILLRFFNQQSMREVGGAFGISEDAAKMRVSRALDRLRNQLSARGVTCPAAALGAFLGERAVEAAPVGVAAAIAAFHYPIATGAAAAATSSTGLLATLSIGKLAAGIGGLALVGILTWQWIERRGSDLDQNVASGTAADAASAEQGTNPAAGPTRDRSAVNSPIQLTPAEMLQAAARARQRIVSGTIEYQVDSLSTTFQNTNQLRIVATFDGHKRRFEQTGREYFYTYDADQEKQEEIKAKSDAFGFDKEGAVRAGYLNPFEAHRVTIYDGTSLMEYSESDGKPQSTQLDDPGKGSSSYVFDPRTFGLTTSTYPLTTIERALMLEAAGAFELVGKEAVDGIDAWHLRRSDEVRYDLWLDAANAARVLKVDDGGSVMVAKYGRDTAGPLPVEVTFTHLGPNRAIQSESRFVQTAAQFNMPVEPATFTLAGLGMKIGTDVIDRRVHQRLGYWTGSGLSEDLPRKTAAAGASEEEKPTLEEMLAILDNIDPASLVAFDAARWILLNTQDGPEVEKAAGVILREHVRSPELLSFCQEMGRMRHRCTQELLQAVLKENPNDEIRATACFTLATISKDQCKYGEDKPLTARAEKFFERVVNEFSKAGRTGENLAWKATAELSELRRLTVGKQAPDLEATDIDGKLRRLGDLRGKVVVVHFFWDAFPVNGPDQHFKMLAPFANRQFAWIGIYGDDDLDKAVAAVGKDQIPWPIIWDGRGGPISTDWNVRGWPHTFVLDRQGVIRARGLREGEVVRKVTELLAE